MSYSYDLDETITLHVKGRISKLDARRQKATARVILHRLEVYPGIILADEVGMGRYSPIAKASGEIRHKKATNAIPAPIPTKVH